MKKVLLYSVIVLFILITNTCEAKTCYSDSDCEPGGLCNYVNKICITDFSHLEYYGYYINSDDLSSLSSLSDYTNTLTCRDLACLKNAKDFGLKAIYIIQSVFENNPESEWDNEARKNSESVIDYMNEILAIYVRDEPQYPPFDKAKLSKMIDITKKYFPNKPTMMVFDKTFDPPENLDWIGIDPYFNPINNIGCAEKNKFMDRVWYNKTKVEGYSLYWSSLEWASQFNKPILLVGQSFEYDFPLFNLYYPIPSTCQQNWYFEAAKAHPLVKGLLWFIYSSEKDISFSWGTREDIPILADYDGDNKDNIAVWRPSNGYWYILNVGEFQYGMNGDIPVPGDYNGDGITDLALWRPSEKNWYIGFFDGSKITDQKVIKYGIGGDTLIPGDYDGNGITDLAIWRPSEMNLYIGFFDGSQIIKQNIVEWKNTGTFVIKDYDGDGKDDIAVFDKGTWNINKTREGSFTINFGIQNDIPVPADYDGDGKTDLAVWRPEGGNWFIKKSSDGATEVKQYGTNGDIPLPINYDSTKYIPAVWRKYEGIISEPLWFILTGKGAVTGIKNYPDIIELHKEIGNKILNEIRISVDFNNDNKIDIIDLSLIAQKFGKKSSDAGWVANYDVVSNNEIDIFDIVYVSSRFT